MARLLRALALVLAILILSGIPLAPPGSILRGQNNPIVVENQYLGSRAWRIDYNIGRIADDVEQQVRGYASAVSVNHGETIHFHVTVNPAQSYKVDIFRMGWYAGAGGRLLQSSGELSGSPQPDCPVNGASGMVSCDWAVGYTLSVPATWTTGIYLAKLTNAAGFQSYIVFAVRDDERVATFLYQQPVTTYQAYNNYPDNGSTGKSLYDFNSYGTATAAATQRANQVSFDRPYGGGGGADGGGQFADDQWWERYFISWAEQMGYDISYSTDIDTHANPARLLDFKGVLSVGHDEYWSKQMYDAFEQARDAGVNLAFLGANPNYWQVRFAPSNRGIANRVMISYKSATLDPITDPALKTDQWRNIGRAEQQLVGVQYVANGDFLNTQPYAIANRSHWIWADSGFDNGSSVPGLLGYEVDRYFEEYSAPQFLSYTKLAESRYLATDGDSSVEEVSQSSIYQAPSGAWVFATGTMSWVWALDRPGYVNRGVRQAATNILDRFGGIIISDTVTMATEIPFTTPTAIATFTPRATISASATPTAKNTATPQ